MNIIRVNEKAYALGSTGDYSTSVYYRLETRDEEERRSIES